MANWYDKYLSIYGKPFSEVPQEIIDGTRERLAALQSDKPIASVVVIGYIEIRKLMSHPATFSQICNFCQSRFSNLAFFFLSKLPSLICVFTIWVIGKVKNLI